MKRLITIRNHAGRAEKLCRMVLSCLFASVILLFGSCSMIDEDRSDCNTAALNYELTLVTNMTTELRTQLTTSTDIKLASELRQHLSDVFTDFAHDVDLSFYDTVGDSIRLQHDEHFMDANQASYTLNLPMRQYMHLATANILDNKLVSLESDMLCHPSHLQQINSDTIDSHTTGIFTARLPMDVLEGVSQNFDVHLYMVNCAAALVIDPREYDTEDIQVYSTGFASRFNICDSAYMFAEIPPIVRTTKILNKDENSGDVAYCSVTFPSKEPHTTRTVIETEEPFVAQPDEKGLWEFRVYVPHPNADGTRAGKSVTETVLRSKDPLRAGQLKIIKCWVGSDGVIYPMDKEIGTSVTLDWKPGLEIKT